MPRTDAASPSAEQDLGSTVEVGVHDERVTAAGLLFEAADGLQDALAATIAGTGLTFAELGVLLRLARSPEGRLRMADLAAQVAMSASGLTRLVDRLERADLVQREVCPTDRRGALAVVTAEGLQRVTESLPEHVEVVQRYFTGLLDADELESFLGRLRRIRDAVRPDATAGARRSRLPGRS